MLQSHTDIEALRGILSPCDDPQFAWSGLPEHEIERVVTISQNLGEANRDRIFSIAAHTKKLEQATREKIWLMLENFDSSSNGDFGSFVRKKIYIEQLGWNSTNAFVRDKIPEGV